MFTLLEFIALPLSYQQVYIAQCCTYLSYHSETETMSCFLYSADRFFVEVWYDEDQGEITRIRPFTHRRLLEPYLKKVDIIPLLSHL
jgi:hypothetical protein